MQTFRENPSQEILIACDLPQFPFLFSPRDLISLLCESSNGSCCKETKNAEHSCRNVRRSSAARAIREELQQTFLSILLLLVRFHRFRTHLDFFHTRSQRNLGWGKVITGESSSDWHSENARPRNNAERWKLKGN